MQYLTEKLIKDLINKIDLHCGFEVYVVTKSEPYLKKMNFYEGKPDNFKIKLKEMVLQILAEKYGTDDAKYVTINRLADEQKKFYIIKTGNEYNPFSFLNDFKTVSFSVKDINDATGIIFMLRCDQKLIWAYQHLWSIRIPNKSKKNCLARIISANESDIFEEFTEPLITIAKNIDLLILDEFIITDNYKLLENNFSFQDYIRKSAKEVVRKIDSKGLIVSKKKLIDYINRNKIKYSKKIMRIADSMVLNLPLDKLLANIHKSNRWNGKIKEENGKFLINTYSQVEYLIDLLDERYTKSDITGVEYDTSVKHVIQSDI